MSKSTMVVRLLDDCDLVQNVGVKVRDQSINICCSCGEKNGPLLIFNVDPNHFYTKDLCVPWITLCPSCLKDMNDTIQALLFGAGLNCNITAEVKTDKESISAIKDNIARQFFGQTCDRCGLILARSSVNLNGLLLCKDCGRIELNHDHERNHPPPKLLKLPEIVGSRKKK